MADITGSFTLPFIIPLMGYAVIALYAFNIVKGEIK